MHVTDFSHQAVRFGMVVEKVSLVPWNSLVSNKQCIMDVVSVGTPVLHAGHRAVWILLPA